MKTREGVLEIPDREEDADELPDGENQGGGEAGALRGQDEHGEDADVLETDVGGKMKDHDWCTDLDDGNDDWWTVQANLPMMNNIRIEEEEER